MTPGSCITLACIALFAMSAATIPASAQLHAGSATTSGGTADHFKLTPSSKQRSKLTLEKVRYGGGSLPASTRIFPEAGDLFFPIGDSIQLLAGYPGEGYRFKYWSSRGNPDIDRNSSESLKIVQTSDDLTVEAVFEQIPVDTLAAYGGNNGRGMLYSSRWYPLATNSGHPVHRQDSVWAIAVADSGYLFDRWESDDTRYDNLTTPLVNISSEGGGVVVTAMFRAVGEHDPYSYCGQLLSAAGTTFAGGRISPNDCITGDGPDSARLVANVYDADGSQKCLEIIRRIDPDGASVDYRGDGVAHDFREWTLQQSGPVVRFIVARKEYSLTVNRSTIDGVALPSEGYVTISPDKPMYECDEMVTLTAFDDEAAGVRFVRWEPSMVRAKTLTIPMYEQRNVTAIYESDFKLVSHEWYLTSETETTTRSPFENALYVQILPTSPPSTVMILNFNRPVDRTKLTHDDGSSKIRVVETSPRIDSMIVGSGREQTYTPESVTDAQWSDDGTTLQMTLTNSGSGLSVQKFQELHIYVDELVSTTGVSMRPLGGPIYAHTEAPDGPSAVRDGSFDRILSITVVPNPASSSAILRADTPIEHVRFARVTGEHVLTIDGNGGTEVPMTLTGLAAGVYLVETTMVDGRRVTMRFVRR